MKTTKKWLSLFLALAMILACLPQISLPVRAADDAGKCGDNLSWDIRVTDGELNISGTGKMWDWTVGWDTPNSGAAPWSEYAEDIRTVIIQDGVTSIGSGAFSGCKQLTKVEIPDTVTSIGASAFFNCGKLSQMTLPDGLIRIGEEAFNYSGINRVTIPFSTTSIGKAAFANGGVVYAVYVLNKDCVIDSQRDTLGKPETTKIYCYKNSTAEAYAKQNGYQFQELVDPSGACGNGLTWALKISTGELTISGTGRMQDMAEYRIAPWWNYAEYIKHVIFAPGVTHVGDKTFCFCENIKRVSFPYTMKTIGVNAFYCCYSLKDLPLPDGLTDIGNGAFGCCYSLKDLSIPGSVTRIGNAGFRGCKGLTEVTIPASVTSVETAGFYECDNLTRVTILNQNCKLDFYSDYLGDSAKATIYGYQGSTAESFAAQRGYKFVGIKDSGTCGANLNWTLDLNTGTLAVTGSGDMRNWDVENPPWYDFADAIRTVDLEYGVTGIGAYAFFRCGHLTRAVVPGSVARIGENAFLDCAELTDVTILNKDCSFPTEAGVLGDPAGVKVHSYKGSTAEIYAQQYGYAFEAVVNPTGKCGADLSWTYDLASGELTITGTGKMWDWMDDAPWKGYQPTITAVTIENGASNIGEYAFYHCSKMADAAIPDSVTQIGFSAFEGCSGLMEVTLPAHLTALDGYAFASCTSLTDLALPGSVASIGDKAFSGSGLYRVTILNKDCAIFDGETTLGDPAKTLIRGWKGSTAETYAGKYHYQFEEIPKTSGKCGDHLTWSFDLVTGTLTVSGTGEMDDWADGDAPWFDFASDIKSVVLEQGVTGIGSYAFYICASLSSVSLPQGLTAIGSAAFYACWNLKEIRIPDSVSRIDNQAFYDCGLETITLPAGLRVLSEESFCRCSALQQVKIPDGVTGIEGWAFANCSSLTEVTIPDGVTEIGENAFDQCTALVNVTIPDSVTTIRDQAFYGCNSLTAVTIPSAVTEIGSRAFGYRYDPGNDHYFKAEQFTVIGEAGSYAEQYANENGWRFVAKPKNPFRDVPEGAYYFEPVLWAVVQRITAGTDKTHFSPNDTCTRGQVVTFLWRAAGQPEPKSSRNPFADVKEGAYYYKAVLWAVENKITAGTSATTFSPNDGCTRGQVVTFLWRSAGNPAPGSSKNPFTDVKSDAYFYDPVLWAVEHKITAGTSDTTFSPNDTCTRAQIVTFLYRSDHLK